MRLQKNPFRHGQFPAIVDFEPIHISADPTYPLALLRHCPAAAETPLREMPQLASALGVGAMYFKDESQRMGLGSFKALGAAYVIARDAALKADSTELPSSPDALAGALQGRVYACATAGNHGISVAASARIFGATAVIYVSNTVPAHFVQRLRHLDADVVRIGDDYETAMATAAWDAQHHGWVLLSDSSWPGYVEIPSRVMEGYLVMGAEIVDQLPATPTHIFLQAGVGGMAAAMAAFFRARWGDGLTIVVVEPEAAPTLLASIRAGRPVKINGPSSTMGRLDCKEPSYLALTELSRMADYFVTITDEQCDETVRLLRGHEMWTTPSGAAGVAGVHHAVDQRDVLGLDESSRVLTFITEAQEDDA